MSLANVDSLIAECNKELKKDSNHFLQNSLTEFLIVKICGYYEKEIERIFFKRISKSCDKQTISFFKSKFESWRHLKLENIIGELLGKYDENYKKEFNKLVDPFDKEKYNSLVTNRDLIAHGKNIETTFHEICLYHQAALNIFECLDNVLNKTNVLKYSMELSVMNMNLVHVNIKSINGLSSKYISNDKFENNISCVYSIKLPQNDFFNFIDVDDIFHTLKNYKKEEAIIGVFGTFLVYNADQVSVTDK